MHAHPEQQRHIRRRWRKFNWQRRSQFHERRPEQFKLKNKFKLKLQNNL
jgi:hypothetical protein